MTVKEFIDQLKELPQDVDVIATYPDEDGCTGYALAGPPELIEVRKLYSTIRRYDYKYDGRHHPIPVVLIKTRSYL